MNFVNAEINIKKKQILIDNLKIDYKIIGDGNIPIILLHGWGLSSDKYLATAKYLSEVESEKSLQLHSGRVKVKSFCIYLLDLPGFGKSDAPPEAWGVDEYVELVRKFIDDFLGGSTSKQEVEPPRKKTVLIGHSFGGRIAIKFAAKYPEKLKALILTGAAGIKHKPTIKQKIFFYLAKTGKIIFSLPFLNLLEKLAQKLLYKVAKEKDYLEALGVMKEVFKKVIDEDLTDYLRQIKTKTLLVWGKNDRSTPLSDAYIMKEKIAGSQLKIVDDANHSLPYQFPEKFVKIISEFIKKMNIYD